MQDAQPSTTKKVVTALVILVAVVLIVLAAKMTTGKEQTSSADPAITSKAATSQSANTGNAQDPSASTGAAYKDGTYEATGSYDTPQATEEITLTVTIKDAVITASDITAVPDARESREFQDQFISGYKELVVGKNIDSIRLSRVSGSSLTSRGFNEALAEIKADAKS